jgi:hypothetical protein
MFKIGDKVRLIDPKLPICQDIQTYTDPDGNDYSVYWTETRASHVGEIAEVEKLSDEWVIAGFIEVAFIREHEYDSFFTEKVNFVMPAAWFVLAYPPKTCVCSIIDLMARGCKCGQMERERGTS